MLRTWVSCVACQGKAQGRGRPQRAMSLPALPPCAGVLIGNDEILLETSHEEGVVFHPSLPLHAPVEVVRNSSFGLGVHVWHHQYFLLARTRHSARGRRRLVRCCLLRHSSVEPKRAAQRRLKETLRALGYTVFPLWRGTVAIASDLHGDVSPSPSWGS